jgi:hypothetical protein
MYKSFFSYLNRKAAGIAKQVGFHTLIYSTVFLGRLSNPDSKVEPLEVLSGGHEERRPSS